MALHRGIVKRCRGNATLQALCKKEGIFLQKPQNVRVGSCFNSKNGSLSQEAQKYCQLNVEAALLLYTKYYLLPDLTKRMFVSDTLPIGSVVDIMPGLGSCTDAIAQGKVNQVSGRWLSNGFNITNRHVLVEVNKVFNGKGVIHYPCDSTGKKKCMWTFKTWNCQ